MIHLTIFYMGVLKYMFYAPNLEQKTSRSTSDKILQLEISQSTSSLLIVFYVESNFLVAGTTAQCEVILSQKQVFEKFTLISVKHCCTCLCKYNPCLNPTCATLPLHCLLIEIVSLLRAHNVWIKIPPP